MDQFAESVEGKFKMFLSLDSIDGQLQSVGGKPTLSTAKS